MLCNIVASRIGKLISNEVSEVAFEELTLNYVSGVIDLIFFL